MNQLLQKNSTPMLLNVADQFLSLVYTGLLVLWLTSIAISHKILFVHVQLHCQKNIK